MSGTYSTYEAKARFSELMRKVRSGQRVTISYRGEAVAEMRPIYRPDDPGKALKEMEEEGVLAPPLAPQGRLEPMVRKKGALKRFLESRE
jgi:antitoxin (DNA-binding transcriptional repressor) of toxin-antitoxin stability system